MELGLNEVNLQSVLIRLIHSYRLQSEFLAFIKNWKFLVFVVVFFIQRSIKNHPKIMSHTLVLFLYSAH